MGALTDFGPDGTVVADPPAELLERLVFRERGGLWRVGGGSGSLSVGADRGPKPSARMPGQPSLMFFLVPRHGFFFTSFKPGPGGVMRGVPAVGRTPHRRADLRVRGRRRPG